jgi:ATP-dependent exoDNAse (exonuclease V) beta subunit
MTMMRLKRGPLTEQHRPFSNDQSQRLEALDPSSSFIVQAPAGSGKTELLIQRYLTLLAMVKFPESVVAVTFTRKAAGEMRHRIVDALQKAVHEPPTEGHKKQTWELCRRVLARDHELGWQLISHPTRMRIQTIDSLCGMLVGQMPWLSRMGASASPEEKAEHLYRKAARLTIELLSGLDSRGAAVERLLRHLDNNVGTVERLLTGMLMSRDQWLRHIFPHRGSADLRPVIESAMRQIISEELKVVRSKFPPELVSETIRFVNFAAANLSHENPLSDLASCGGLRDLPGTDFEKLNQWRGIAELLLTNAGSRRKVVNKNTGFPSTPECAEEKKRCVEMAFPEGFLSALHGVRSLPPAEFTESQWEVLNALTELLPVAVAQLKVVFQNAGNVDFTEVSQAASRALGTRDNPTDLAFSLDCRIQHLLVDEFQDTSQSQFELLEKLISEWQPGDGRTLFLVGDPMQSIFGFRNAEVALFMKARDMGVANVRPTPLTLSVNFRSNDGIVNWVNQALGEAFPEKEDILRGAVTYKKSVAARVGSSPSAVEIHPFFDKDGDGEARTVVEIIQRTRRGRQDGTIAVIVRARTHLLNIVNALRSSGEKFRAVEIDSLGTRSVVQDLLALTAALIHLGDRNAWLSILRAPWCGLTLADLESLAGGDFQSAIWSLLTDNDRRSQLSMDGQLRMNRIVAILSEALEQRGRLPLRRWVEATWMALGGPACLKDPTDLEDASSYLDLLEASASGIDLLDAKRFVDDVQSLFARPDSQSDGKLQLLTIHKAKGLEFDTVILPGLGRIAKSDASQLLLWLEYLDSSEKSRLLFAPIKESGTKSDPAYAYVRKIKAEKTANESMRLLYVAATRARSNLHLLGHTEIEPESGLVKEPDSRSLLKRFWPAAASVFQRAAESRVTPSIANDSLEPSPIPPGIPLRRLSNRWQSVPPPPDIEWQSFAAGDIPDNDEISDRVLFDWATDLQRHVGIVVHAMLQNAGDGEQFENCVSTISAALTAEGLYGDRLREGIARVEKALRSTATDERGKWILRRHIEDQREFALCGLVGHRVRYFKLDRTFVDDGIRWIIDYKSGPHQGGDLEAFLNSEQERYRPQLENYARLMKLMDSRPIRMGLYFPMLQSWREWN